MRPCLAAALALACAAGSTAHAQEWREFSSRGLPRSEGVTVRINHPATWRRVDPDDELALAELRGAQGRLTGTLQIGRGLPRKDMETLCRPERARTMLQNLEADDQARVTEVQARTHQGRPAYSLRYERHSPPTFTVVRSLIVCLRDSQLLVSCAGSGDARGALADIEPVCRQVLESVSVSED
jgi:hypothetical protein